MDESSVGARAWVSVGRVRGAFGVDGACRVTPYSDPETTVLRRIRQWRLAAPAGGDAPSPTTRPFPLPALLQVRSVRSHVDTVVARFVEPLSREQVEALKGCEVQVDRAEFPPTDSDEYYWSDLIGCRVVSTGGDLLGTVADLEDRGAQLLLKLEGGMLIPFVAAIVVSVDVASRRIVADWAVDWL